MKNSWGINIKIAILVILGVIFIGAAIKEQYPYVKAAQENKRIRAEYADGDDKEEGDAKHGKDINFAGLQGMNPDIVGWIEIPGTPIDYPILKNPYDNYYLTHSPSGAYSELGSIFMQASADAGFNGKHTILYGHNLADGQMFGSLDVYAAKDARDAQPYIYIYLPGERLRGTVYSAYICQDQSEAYQLTYKDMDAYLNWLDMTVVDSNYTSVHPKGTDKVLTLSTCTDTGADRFVIHSILEEYE